MKCVHCLGEAGNTKDHVFPRGWYPENTPSNIQRPTVPSCAMCNNSLGGMEKELFIRMALCVDPDHPEAIGINSKLLRSFGLGIDENSVPLEEVEKRRKLLKKILNETKPYTPDTKAFPGLGLHEGFPPELQVTTPVPFKELEEVSKKIVRGLEYIFGGKRYIEKPYEVKVYFLEEKHEIRSLYDLLRKHGTQIPYGPGFYVERAAANDKTKSVIYQIKVWNKLTIFGSVMTPDLDRDGSEKLGRKC